MRGWYYYAYVRQTSATAGRPVLPQILAVYNPSTREASCFSVQGPATEPLLGPTGKELRNRIAFSAVNSGILHQSGFTGASGPWLDAQKNAGRFWPLSGPFQARSAPSGYELAEGSARRAEDGVLAGGLLAVGRDVLRDIVKARTTCGCLPEFRCTRKPHMILVETTVLWLETAWKPHI